MILDIDPRGVRLFVLTITFLILVWLFLSLRALVKYLTVRKVSLDDWLMFVAILLYTAHSTITLWGIVYASQEGGEDFIRGENIALRSWFLGEVLYAPLSAFIRTSIALFLLRIATHKTHRQIIHACIGATWIMTVVYFFLVLFQCSPPSHFYDQVLDPSGGSCMHKDRVPKATIAHSIICAVVDLLLAFLPVPILWNVRLNKRTKVGIAALLSMGLFAGVALIIRVPYVRFIDIADPKFLEQTNGTAFWSVMETSLGIIAGCAVTLRPLMSGFRPRTVHRRRNNNVARRKRNPPPSPPSILQPGRGSGNEGGRGRGGECIAQSQRHRHQETQDGDQDHNNTPPPYTITATRQTCSSTLRDRDGDDMHGAISSTSPPYYNTDLDNRATQQQKQQHTSPIMIPPPRRRYEFRRCESPINISRIWDRTPASPTVYSPVNSDFGGGMHIKTSREIKGGPGPPHWGRRGASLSGGSLSLHPGEQVVTIKGPPTAYHNRFAHHSRSFTD